MYNFDDYTTEEIYKMISDGLITNQDVVEFYNNEWWDDEYKHTN
jgi:hypothetical protein